MRKRKPNKYERSDNYRTEFMRRWPPEPGGYYHCVYCGKKIPVSKMQVDHVLAVDMAKKNWLSRILLPPEGVNSTKNLVPSCQRCNRKKSNYGGLWLIRGYYWKICLPLYKLFRLLVILLIIACGIALLGLLGIEPISTWEHTYIAAYINSLFSGFNT